MKSDSAVSIFLLVIGVGIFAWGFLGVLQTPEFMTWLILISGISCFAFGILMIATPPGASQETEKQPFGRGKSGLIVGTASTLCAAVIFAVIGISGGGERSAPNIPTAEARAAELSDKDYYFVLNTDSKVFHNPWCSAVSTLSDKNFGETNLSPDELTEYGYTQCGMRGDFDVEAEPPAPAAELDGAESDASEEPELVVVAIAGTDEALSLPSGTLVWLPANGKKFHSINDCGNMNPEKATQTTVDEASTDGYEACENCW